MWLELCLPDMAVQRSVAASRRCLGDDEISACSKQVDREIWIIRFRYFPEKEEKEKKEVARSLCARQRKDL